MTLIEIIEERLQAAFQPEILRVLDESAAHHGHAAHSQGARHFAIEIYSPHLLGMSRVAAHRKIYALFSDLMPYPLHALKITVLTSLNDVAT